IVSLRGPGGSRVGVTPGERVLRQRSRQRGFVGRAEAVEGDRIAADEAHIPAVFHQPETRGVPVTHNSHRILLAGRSFAPPYLPVCPPPPGRRNRKSPHHARSAVGRRDSAGQAMRATPSKGTAARLRCTPREPGPATPTLQRAVQWRGPEPGAFPIRGYDAARAED